MRGLFPSLPLVACLVLARAGAQPERGRGEEQLPAAAWAAEEVGLGIEWRAARVEHLFGRPQSFNVLLVAPRGTRVDVARARGLERTSTMARRAGALAAVNGGYFKKDGSPDGLLKLDGELVSSRGRGCHAGFGVDPRGRVKIGECPGDDWPGMVDALGAGPLVLENGRVVDHGDAQRRIRHPRTALGQRADGVLVFVVADGRTEQAGGVSFEELGRLMRSLGCRAAVNLDGGGSSVLWIRGRGRHGVVSHPCDNRAFDHEGERKVGNAVLIHGTAVVVLDNRGAKLDAADWRRRSDAKGVHGSDFDWLADGGGATAAWRLALPFPGVWRVFARWPRLRGKLAGRATFRCSSLETLCDQRLRQGRWVEQGRVVVGQAPLDAVLAGRKGEPLAVDALRFVQRAGR